MGTEPVGQPDPWSHAGPVAGRDLAALRWVGEQYACRGDHLAQLMAGARVLSPFQVRAVLIRWQRLGLAEQGSFIAGDPPWTWLNKAGLRRAGLPYRVWQPKAWMLAHIAAINRVRLFVEPRRPGARWVPERELRMHPGDHPIPDAELHDPGGTVTAIEVELSAKSTERRRRVMQELVAHYDSVWYFASVAAWNAVHDASCSVPVQLTDLVRIYALEDC